MKFTLRDLFWLIFIVAVFAAWWADHQAVTKWHQRRFSTLSRELSEYCRSRGGDYVKVDDRGEYVEIVTQSGQLIHK